jgi:hypothetical protein
VEDAAAGRHPLDVAGADASLMAERVAVAHLTLAHERHGLDPAVRVIGEAGPIVRRLDRLEVVEQEEWVEVIEAPGADAAPEVDPGALHDRLWRHDDLAHSSRRRHGQGLQCVWLASTPSV